MFQITVWIEECFEAFFIVVREGLVQYYTYMINATKPRGFDQPPRLTLKYKTSNIWGQTHSPEVSN